MVSSHSEKNYRKNKLKVRSEWTTNATVIFCNKKELFYRIWKLELNNEDNKTK